MFLTPSPFTLLKILATLAGGVGNFKTIHRASQKSHAKHKQSLAANYSNATAYPTATDEATSNSVNLAPSKTRTSFRERLKKSSTVTNTQRLLKALNPDSTNTSNTSPLNPQSTSLDANAAVGSVPVTAEAMKKYIEVIGSHMTNLAAMLEALLLGLYNTFARAHLAASSGAVYTALPPFASGSVFCGPLNAPSTKSEGELVEGLLQLFSSRDPASVSCLPFSHSSLLVYL